MDTVANIFMVVVLISQGLDVLAMPFMFGQSRKPYSPSTWLVSTGVFVGLLVVAGSLWGWW